MELCLAKNKFQDALKYVLRALEIVAKLTKPYDWFLIIELIDLRANAALACEKLCKVDDLLAHSKAMLELYKNHSDRIINFHGHQAYYLTLSMTYDATGGAYYKYYRFDEALEYFYKAKETREQHLSGHPDIAVSYELIGMIYKDLSSYDKALEYFKKALKIKEEFLIPSYSDYVNMCDIVQLHNRIGTVYDDLGCYEYALNAYNHCLTLLNEIQPVENSMIATIHNNKGVIFNRLGRYQDALESYTAAMTHYIKELPPEHSHITDLHNNIGVLYFNWQKYEESKFHYITSLKHREKVLPPEHHDIAKSYNALFWFHNLTGQKDDALAYASKLLSLLPSIYHNILSATSYEIKLLYVRSVDFFMHGIHTAACANTDWINEYNLYNLLLQTKDINTEANFIVRAYLHPDLYPDEALKLKELNEKQAYLQSPHLLGDENKEERDVIIREIYDIEKELAPHVREINFKQHMAGITTAKVLNSIPPNCALLEYGWFYFTESAVSIKEGVRQSGKYYAFLLRHGDDRPILRYLSFDDDIHFALNTFRRKISSAKTVSFEDDFGHTSNKEADPQNSDTELSFLYKLLLSPFADDLHSIKHLYIAPDGELFKLPFELLCDENNQMLSDTYSISYLSSGRDFVRFKNENNLTQNYSDALVLADPIYHLNLVDGTSQDKTESDKNILDDTPKIGSTQSLNINDLDEFKPLPFSKTQAETFVNTFNNIAHSKIDRFYGSDATKNVLSKVCQNHLSSPSLILFITHGFFLEKQGASEKLNNETLMGKLPHHWAEDPLVRSGLAFSGVNDYIRSSKSVPLNEKYGDGILNAKEVLALNLQETDLLVLSACQTGLGEVRNGEGIQGLRRAFELAGVNCLLCTLWSVWDIPSAILIEQFFSNLLILEMSKLDALSNAKKYVKNMSRADLYNYLKEKGYLEEAEKMKSSFIGSKNHWEKYPIYESPYYWAGYVFQGNVGPIG